MLWSVAVVGFAAVAGAAGVRECRVCYDFSHLVAAGPITAAERRKLTQRLLRDEHDVARYGELKHQAEARVERETRFLEQGASDAELLALEPIIQREPGLKQEGLRLLLSPAGPTGHSKDRHTRSSSSENAAWDGVHVDKELSPRAKAKVRTFVALPGVVP